MHILASVRRLVALVLFVGLFGALTLSADPVSTPPRKEEDGRSASLKTVDLKELRPGMSAAEVRQKLGSPRQTARQILYGRYLEQWTYDVPLPVRIEFDWRKGQERQILTVQALTSPPR